MTCLECKTSGHGLGKLIIRYEKYLIEVKATHVWVALYQHHPSNVKIIILNVEDRKRLKGAVVEEKKEEVKKTPVKKVESKPKEVKKK